MKSSEKPAGLRRVLIVTPHWPPINAPDMQRVRMSLPYYRAHGWEPVVLAVGDRWVRRVREPELVETVPPGTEVHFCSALSPGWTSAIGLNNLGLRAWWFLFLDGSRLIRKHRIDLVFFSNTQFVTFTLGRIWRRLFGTPYVFDIQDPWRTDYYERAGSRRPPGGWKYQIARFQAWLLEGWSYRRISGAISVSPSYLTDLAARYPRFASVPCRVIGFGASPADNERAAQLSPPRNNFQRKPGEIHFLYTGASGPVMPHSLTVLFESLRRYRERSPEKAGRLRFHFIGTSYVPPGMGSFSVMPVAKGCGVDSQVDEVPHRIGHLESIRLQMDADALLLPGSSDLAYSPSKVYPYYLTGRPILALVFRGGVMEALLHELNCATVVSFSENEPKEPAYAAVADFFDKAIAGFPKDALPRRNDDFFNRHYLAEALTGTQCELFDRALAHSHV